MRVDRTSGQLARHDVTEHCLVSITPDDDRIHQATSELLCEFLRREFRRRGVARTRSRSARPRPVVSPSRPSTGCTGRRRSPELRRRLDRASCRPSEPHVRDGRRDHSASRRNKTDASRSAPRTRSSTSVNSPGAWLTPPLRLGTKIIPAGQMPLTIWVSWLAPLAMNR